MKRLLALLLLCLLMDAVLAVADEEMNWYQYWMQEMNVNLGEENGQLEEDTGVRNYIDLTGTTSGIIGEKNDKNSVIWVKEEAGGKSAWFGLDNSEGVFEEGSRFWVRWLNREQDSKEWEYCYNRFDDEHKRAVDNEHLWIFLIGVTNPDGDAYSELMRDVPLYVQIDDAWDEEDIHAAYIAEGKDEAYLVSYAEKLRYPGGVGDFGEVRLNHFSPYTIYETGVTAPDLPQTGDHSRLALWCMTMMIAGAVMILMRRRAHN